MTADRALRRSLNNQIGALSTQIATLGTEILQLKKKKEPSSVKLITAPKALGGGDKDMASFRLKVDFLNKPRFESYLAELALPGFDLSVEPFDVFYVKGVNRRGDHKNGYDRLGTFKYTLSGSALRAPSSLIYPSRQAAGHPYQSMSWNTYNRMKTECQGDPYYGGSFGLKPWDMGASGGGFTPYTRASWAFTEDINAPLPTLKFNDMNSVPTQGKATFNVKSIAAKCIVESSATFVAGFLICDEFIIQSRSLPLEIVGTVITSRLQIHPSALLAGIRWFSAYHPNRTQKLRDVGILTPNGGGRCPAYQNNLNRPIWHPYPGLLNLANHYKCNTIHLRAKADNLRWTTVDPDCATLRGEASAFL